MRITQPAVYLLLACAALPAIPRVATAIAMRDDVPEQSYLDLANQPGFNAIGLVNMNGGTCTGTLVAPNLVVTAAHCWDQNEDNLPDSIAGAQFIIGPDSNNPLETIDIMDVQVNQWNGQSQFDFAVITLASNVTMATPLTLSAMDPLGQTATVVGYGLAGTGDIDVSLYNFDGQRRAAENIIDDTSTGYLRTDFDMPASTAANNTNSLTGGDFNPLPLEGTGAPGDSGGPILVDFGNGPQVVGVLNGTDAQFFPNPFGVTNGYGEVCAWAAVSDPTNMAFLQSNGVQIDMGPTGSAPVAVDDAYTTPQDQTLTVNAPGVLMNDSDPDADPISAVPVSASNFTLNADGSFTYTPAPGFTGTDTLTYSVTDGTSTTDGTITIAVTPVVNPLACLDEVAALVDAYQVFADTTVAQANAEINALQQAGDIAGALNRASSARTALTQEAGVVSQNIMNLCAMCVADLQTQGMSALVPQVQTECMNQSDRVGTIQATAVSQIESVNVPAPTARPSRAVLALQARNLEAIRRNMEAAVTSVDRFGDRYVTIVGRHAAGGDAAGAAAAETMARSVIQQSTAARIARIQQVADSFAARFAGNTNAQGAVAEISLAAAEAIAQIQAAEAETLQAIQSSTS